jgi:hypothetical protein
VQDYPVAMERAAWTDERLDDLARRMDAGFERVDRGIRNLRLELSGQIEGLRQTILRVGGGMLAGMMVGFISVLVAILAGGA